MAKAYNEQDKQIQLLMNLATVRMRELDEIINYNDKIKEFLNKDNMKKDNKGDKRSIATDALQVLGNIITENTKVGRDAIHLAVEPVIAGEKLYAGQDIGLHNKMAYGYKSDAKKSVKPLGIVDPFIMHPVEKGQKFLLVVYPRQITSLRHVWSHPDFPEDTSELDLKKIEVETKIVLDGIQNKYLVEEQEKTQAYSTMQIFANEIDVTYEELMKGADAYLKYNHHMSDGGKFEGINMPEDFWDAYEILRGIKVPSNKRDSFFSCAC